MSKLIKSAKAANAFLNDNADELMAAVSLAFVLGIGGTVVYGVVTLLQSLANLPH